MGKAIILPNVDFSDSGLGKVTLLGVVPIVGLSINSPASIIGSTYLLTASFSPLNTTQRNISWTIESGAQYASINATSGLLTINSQAQNNDITVKVASTDNPAVYATKVINVTHAGSSIEYLSYIKSTPGSYVDTGIIPFAGMKLRFIGNKGNVPGVAGIICVQGANDSAYKLYYTARSLGFASPTRTQACVFTWQSGFDSTMIEIMVEASTVKSKLLDSDVWSAWAGTYTIPQSIGYSLYLFCNNTLGQADFTDLTAECAIRQITIYDSSDNIVADFRAVLADGTPCFRDEVSGNLFNIQGNGTITYERLLNE